MSYYVQLTISGLATGMVYALMAIGLVLLIRAAGTFNFAQGQFLVVGAFVTYCLLEQLHVNRGVSVLIEFIIFAVLGALFMGLVYNPVSNSKWGQAVTVSCIGASMVLREICVLIWGSRALSYGPIIPGSIEIFGAYIEIQYLCIIAVASAIVALVLLFFDKLYCGRIMQAAAEDKYAAELLGINTKITTMVTFSVVFIIVAFGGGLVAPILTVSVSLSGLQSKAFASVVIGGVGSVKGAIIGGLLIGLIESYATIFTTTYKDVVVFVVLLLVLMFKPTGLFGELSSDKA